MYFSYDMLEYAIGHNMPIRTAYLYCKNLTMFTAYNENINKINTMDDLLV